MWMFPSKSEAIDIDSPAESTVSVVHCQVCPTIEAGKQSKRKETARNESVRKFAQSIRGIFPCNSPFRFNSLTEVSKSTAPQFGFFSSEWESVPPDFKTSVSLFGPLLLSSNYI
jgi:hypothetical protein